MRRLGLGDRPLGIEQLRGSLSELALGGLGALGRARRHLGRRRHLGAQRRLAVGRRLALGLQLALADAEHLAGARRLLLGLRRLRLRRL